MKYHPPTFDGSEPPMRSPTLQAVLLLLDALTEDERDLIAKKLASRAKPFSISGELPNAILAAAQPGVEHEIQSLIRAVSAHLPCYSDKQIHNSISHLTARGGLKRVGLGRYVNLAVKRRK